MATHVVELVIKRFYKVYVEDPDNSMTKEQAEAKAKELAIDDESNLQLSDGIEIEADDIEWCDYQYDI